MEVLWESEPGAHAKIMERLYDYPVECTNCGYLGKDSADQFCCTALIPPCGGEWENEK